MALKPSPSEPQLSNLNDTGRLSVVIDLLTIIAGGVPGSNNTAPGNNSAYSLLNNATATGPAAVGVPAGSYIWSYLSAGWNGATAALQVLGPDGVTWQQVATATENGQQGVVIGANASVRVAISAAVPSSGVYSTIS